MDEFEEKLEKSTIKLQKCQENHKSNSCMYCDEFINCETRLEYVFDVHNSMSKAQSGSFEFN